MNPSNGRDSITVVRFISRTRRSASVIAPATGRTTFCSTKFAA